VVRLVDVDWLESQLGSPALTLIDPRRPVKYLQGHIRTAINVPASKAFDDTGRLLPDDRLTHWLGGSGVGTTGRVVVYDDYDAQSGSMIAWILEYLGHPDVRFLTSPFSRWRDEGREIFYRPVPARQSTIDPRPRSSLRASWKDLTRDPPVNLLDVRNPDEYSGRPGEARSGHIPRAKNIPWLSFVGAEQTLFPLDSRVRRSLDEAGIRPDRKTIVYCQVGTRAAVALVALQQLGYDVSLYDGSFADWKQRAELPVEVS
jgi:thiosulfate/3-mercaptopyruvate sulfurtransferase